MEYNISGVILAGGENKRFGGRSKTDILIEGKPIIERIAESIRDLFDELIIVSNEPGKYNKFSRFRIVSDIFPKAGPLGGLHASIKASTKKAVFVFGGDMPFLDKTLICSQIDEFFKYKCDALVPVVNSLPEPLHSIYSNTILENLEKYLSEKPDRTVHNFLSEIDTHYLKMSQTEEVIRSFTNINSPADLTDFK